MAAPPICSSITAKDQHHPASSRAIATLAIVERFFRSSIRTQRLCNLRLLASPRARAAAGARSQRSRMILPMQYARRWCQAALTSSRQAWCYRYW